MSKNNFFKEGMKALQKSSLEKIRNTTLGQEEKLRRELREHRELEIKVHVVNLNYSCNK